MGVFAAILLAACGGGKGGGSGLAAPVTEAPKMRVSTGDSYTYSRRDTTADGTTTAYYFSREYQLVNSDGSSVDVETFSNTFAATVTSVSANGGITAAAMKNDTATPACSYSPEHIGATLPYQVGKAWDNSWTQACGATVVRGTNKGSIVGQEAVTVAAGTFNAFKEVYVITTQQTSPASEQLTTSNITCWRDVDLKQYVKCEFALTHSNPAAAGPQAIARTSYALESYIASGTAHSTPTPARFAGTWTARFYGGEIGECANMTISATGAVSGNCIGRVSGMYNGSYPVSGSVDAQGNIRFGPAPGSSFPSFTGRLRTISDADGNWSASPSLSGAWAMYHH